MLGDVAQRLRHHLVEPLRLLNQLLLDREQVPVLADGLQQVVEEVVELTAQIVADEEDVVAQVDLVLAQ